MKKLCTLIGGALLALLAFADRVLVVRDLVEMLKGLSWLEWVLIAIGVIPIFTVIVWIIQAFKEPEE